jgi:hypothetical protein
MPGSGGNCGPRPKMARKVSGTLHGVAGLWQFAAIYELGTVTAPALRRLIDAAAPPGNEAS